MTVCAVKTLIKILWPKPYIDKKEKVIFLHCTSTPDEVEYDFYWFKVNVMFKNKTCHLKQPKFKVFVYLFIIYRVTPSNLEV